MRKEDKSTVIEQIASTLKEYSHFYLAETAALNAEKTSALRRECFKQDIKLLVVKNALLHKAMESLDTDYTPLYDCLKGSTAVMFTNTGNAPPPFFLSSVLVRGYSSAPVPHSGGSECLNFPHNLSYNPPEPACRPPQKRRR